MPPVDKGEEKLRGGNEKSGGGVRCYRCGSSGHRIVECKNSILTCFKCGRTGHNAEECRSKNVVCYNYGESGHISTKCQKAKKAQSGGNVFALSGEESSKPDSLT